MTYISREQWQSVSSLTEFSGYDYILINPITRSSSLTDYIKLKTEYTPSIYDEEQFLIGNLELTEMKGLFKEDGSYQEGYVSLPDNKGRVYVNSRYNESGGTITPGVTWEPNQQFVDITAEFMPAGVTIPGLSRYDVAWSFEDPDDLSDDGLNANVMLILDPNGDIGNDNTGSLDGKDPWAAITGYPFNITRDKKGAGTSLVNGKTKIRFNTTDDGGDNFIVSARLIDKQENVLAVTSSGVFTVWKLIRLENGYMSGCDDLNDAKWSTVNTYFERAFVQWEILPSVSMTSQDITGSNYKTVLPNYFVNKDNLHYVFVAIARDLVATKILSSAKDPAFDYSKYTDKCEVVEAEPNETYKDIGGMIFLPVDPATNKRVRLKSGTVITGIDIYDENNVRSKSFDMNNVTLGMPDGPEITYAITIKPLSYKVILDRNIPKDNSTSGYHNLSESKTLKDHGFVKGSKLNIKVWEQGDGTAMFRGSGFASPYPLRYCVVYNSSGIGTLIHELSHMLLIGDNPGFVDINNTQKGVMTYNYYWRRNESNTKDPLIKDNGAESDNLEPEVIRAIRTINIENAIEPK